MYESDATRLESRYASAHRSRNADGAEFQHKTPDELVAERMRVGRILLQQQQQYGTTSYANAPCVADAIAGSSRRSNANRRRSSRRSNAISDQQRGERRHTLLARLNEQGVERGLD